MAAIHVMDDQLVTTDPPIVSIILRTQGRRPAGLAQALAALDAQLDRRFEVLLMAHDVDAMGAAAIADGVARTSADLRQRLRVVHVGAGGRARPLAAGLAVASGHHAAFLDDDDLVSDGWIATFAAAVEDHPTRVVRARSWSQDWITDDVGDPIEALGDVVAEWNECFDLLEHIHHNESPICSFAVPIEAIRAEGIDFDPDLPVLEDWDFLMRSVFHFGVVSIGDLTSTYRRSETGGSRSHHGADVWDETIPRVRAGWERDRCALPSGWATQLALAYEARLALDEAVTELRRTIEWQRSEIDRRIAEINDLEARLGAMQATVSWRVTAPLRRLRRR